MKPNKIVFGRVNLKIRELSDNNEGKHNVVWGKEIIVTMYIQKVLMDFI